jgi:hypothetical protein
MTARTLTWAVTLTAMLMLVVACNKPWNTAHTGLEIFNDAAVSTDAVLAEAQQPALDKVKARVEQAYEAELTEYAGCRKLVPVPEGCIDPGDPEAYVAAHYDTDEAVVNWGKVADGVTGIKASILTGEAAVAAWRDAKAQPAEWNGICDAIQVAADQTTEALIEMDVNVPDAWNKGRTMLRPVCNWIVDAATAGEKGMK